MYTPETAVPGTVQDAETDQLPQSYSSVVGSVMHWGWCCGSEADGCHRRDLARTVAPVVPEPEDRDRVRRRIGVDLEVDPRPDVDADVGGEALDGVVPGTRRCPTRSAGVPGLLFSQAILFPPDPHGSTAASAVDVVTAARPDKPRAVAIRTAKRRQPGREGRRIEGET